MNAFGKIGLLMGAARAALSRGSITRGWMTSDISFTYRMPAGIPGAVSRIEAFIGDSVVIDATAALTAPIRYGFPIKTSAAGFMQALVSGDLPNLITGFAVRAYPAGGPVNDALGTSTALTSGLITRMRKGFMTTTLSLGTAAKDAPVFYRTTANGAGKAVGQIEAAAEWGTTVAAAGAGGGGSNTGNGTLTAVVMGPKANVGAYTLKFLTATTFTLVDPNGVELANGAALGAYSDAQIAFTTTAGGTAFVAGDGFTVTTVENAGAIPGAVFTGPADAVGNVEISYNN